MQPTLGEVFARTLNGLGERVAAIGPSVIAMLIVLAVGVIAGGTVRYAVHFVLSRLRFARFARRSGIASVLEKSGLSGDPTRMVAIACGWLVLAMFVVLAIGTLNLELALDLLTRLFLYLPRVLVAVALLILGMMIAAFLRRSVLIAAVNAGLPAARPMAAGVQVGVFTLAVALALDHLGVGRQVILVSFTILFGGLVLALALAFGLAGRDLAHELLERLARGRVEQEPGDTFRHL